MLRDALGQGGQACLVEPLPGLMRVRADAVDRDLDGSTLPGAALRDQRRETTTQALRSLRSNGHDATTIIGSSPAAGGSIRPSRVLSSTERAAIRSGTHRVGRIARDRLAVARRLRQPDVPRDDGLVDPVPEVAANLGGDVGRKLRPRVVHRQDDPLDREVGIEVVADEFEGRKQLGQSFQRVVLALQRDEDAIGGGQCVHGQQPERRRAVDEDVVVRGRGIRQKAGQSMFATFQRCQLDFGSCQGDRGRNDVHPLDRTGHGQVGQWSAIDDRVVDRSLDLVAVEAQAARCVALGIQVDDEDSLARQGEIAPEVHDRRGLADAAFLIRAGDRLPHSAPCSEKYHSV